MGMMNPPRLDISTNMRLHSQKIRVNFLGLMHLWDTFSLFVLGRAEGVNNGG